MWGLTGAITGVIMRKAKGLQRSVTFIAASVALLALSACQSEPENAQEAMLRATGASGCPSINVLEDTSQIQLYRPGGSRTSNDVTSTWVIMDWGGECTYRDDEDGVRVEVDLNLALGARRGPANTAEEVTTNFFIAITDVNKTILAKQIFTSTIELDSELGLGQNIELLRQTIPLQTFAAGADYGIYIGFQPAGRAG